jgi:hypothetical protein
MPDEENMRHWSHHHSTDTVDDPVFRAAMRATDSVSFVFGLEVTWSLIQQRKQDEDDRKALEAIQEAEQEDVVCSAAAGGDEEGGNDDEVSDREDEDVMDVDPLVNHEKSDSPETKVDSSIDKSAEVVLQGQQDENARPWGKVTSMAHGLDTPKCKTPEVRIVDKYQSQGDDSVVQASVIGSQRSSSQRSCCSSQSSPGGSTTKTSSGSKEWQCSTCTLFNKKSLRKCDACGTRRPKAGMKRPLADVCN